MALRTLRIVRIEHYTCVIQAHFNHPSKSGNVEVLGCQFQTSVVPSIRRLRWSVFVVIRFLKPRRHCFETKLRNNL